MKDHATVFRSGLRDEVIARVREADPGGTVKPRRQRRDARGLLHCGLLREAWGLSFPEIGFRLGVSTHSAESRLRDHWKLVTENEGYAVRVTEVFAAAFAGLRTARPQTPSWGRFALTRWGERWESNPRPPEPQSGALTG